jgi:dipeptidase E
MKLLLMSDTFTNDKLKNTFLNMLTKPIQENKALIIHQTEYIKQTYPEYVEYTDTMVPRDTKTFTELGILPENISEYDTKNDDKPDLRDIDVIHVEGGNVYYYLKQFRKNGYMDDIRDFIERDGVYVGISAGSNMMSKVVDDNLTSDENFFGLENVLGFGYIDFNLLVHWDTRDERYLTNFIKYSWETGMKVIPLTDQQAILVLDEGFKIISP